MAIRSSVTTADDWQHETQCFVNKKGSRSLPANGDVKHRSARKPSPRNRRKKNRTKSMNCGEFVIRALNRYEVKTKIKQLNAAQPHIKLCAHNQAKSIN